MDKDNYDFLSKNQVNELRKILIEEIKGKGKLAKTLTIPEDRVCFFNRLIFDYNEGKDKYKTFALPKSVLKKIDFKNISFNDFKVSDQNFKELKGICLNPQLVYNKDLSFSVLYGVKICGSINHCIVTGANFAGSIGAEIDPRKVKYRCLNNCVLRNVKITGSFDECFITGISFAGSSGAEVNPQTLRSKNLSDVNFKDAVIIGTFEGCYIVGASFAGSTGAVIDPQEIDRKNLSRVNLCDARIVNSFENCVVESTKYDGMINDFSASESFMDDCKKLILEVIEESK